MAFDLRIEFAGLCMYVEHPDEEHVAVVMPEARRGRVNPVHADGDTHSEPHVGYARFNLANLQPGVPPGSRRTGPAYEVVHRFDRETLDLGLPKADGKASGNSGMPDFEGFAPALGVLAGALDASPPAAVLMRTLLKGGTFTPVSKREHWIFEDTLNRGKPEYNDHFPNVVEWERTIDAADLTVTLRSFDSGSPSQLRLQPVDDGSGKPSIVIKVANLCSENPLEWPDLSLHQVNRADRDFKWMYRLTAPTTGTLADMLQPDELLPIPLQPGATPFSVQGCMGARKRTTFDPSRISA